jgi:glycosyltransferase involved in cell wall biosynthesis
VSAAQTSPRLTVAIPTCNGAAHLAEALRSVLAQDDVAYELIVSDDRSDDDTLAVVRAVAGDRARAVQNAERQGLAGNWNRCIALAHSPFVAVFHQDDVMLPGHLAAHLAALADDDSIGLVASASGVIDGSGRSVPEIEVERGGLGSIDRIYEPGQLAEAMAGGNPLRCSAVTLRTSALTDVGGFDPSYRYVVDWDFWLRLSRKWRVGWLARPTVLVRWHPASEAHRFKTGTTDLDETERILERLFMEDLKDHAAAAGIRRRARTRLARAFLNRAHEALHAGSPDLARAALRRGLKHSPRAVGTLVRDPRLAIQMAVLAASPRLAKRWFAGGASKDLNA